MTKLWWALIAVAVGAFVAGRASVRPADQTVRDSLGAYRAAKAGYEHTITVLMQDNARLEAKAAASDSSATSWRQLANRATVSANAVRDSADALERRLAQALTPRDSLIVLGQVCAERKQECELLREANASLLSAAADDSTSKARLREEIANWRSIRGADSTRQAQADRLVKQLERSARGCRLPLVAVPCPTGTASYDLTDRGFHFGAGIPVKRWLTIGVTWKP